MKTINVRPVYIYFSEYDHKSSVPLLIVLYFRTNSFNPVLDNQNEKKKTLFSSVHTTYSVHSKLPSMLGVHQLHSKYKMNRFFFLLTRGSQGCFRVAGQTMVSET